MVYRRSALSIVLHSITSFIILIVLLIIANILVASINNGTYSNIIQFCNSLLGLFILLFVVGLVNSLFWNFNFPLNLLAPITGGIFGVLIVNLVYKILEFTQTFVYFNELNSLLSYNISAIVFFATLIIGYLIIITEWNREERNYPREEIRDIENRKDKDERYSREDKKIEAKDSKKNSKQNTSWQEVGDELKKVPLNIGKALNKALDGKDKKKKKKKAR